MAKIAFPLTSMHIKPPLSEAHQLQEIAIKTGGAPHSGSTCHVVMEVCDGHGKCCQTSSDGLDNPGHVDREIGEIDIYTNTTILGNCAEAVDNNAFPCLIAMSNGFHQFVLFSGEIA